MSQSIADNEYRHSIMLPDELNADRRMTAPLGFGRMVLQNWLLEATGAPNVMLFPTYARNLYYTPAWDTKPTKHPFTPVFISTITNEQVEILLNTASNPGTPEPVPMVLDDHINQAIGFDVWGMGQHIRPILIRGDAHEREVLTLPTDRWTIHRASIA
jgi:hypothetical protein